MATMMADCARCGNHAEHHVRSTGTKASACIECSRAYSRAHYATHRTTYLARRPANRRSARARRREIVQSAKAGPCTDCGLTWPYYVMQFDHRDPASKCFNIGSADKDGVSVERLLAEIAKCDPVCGNCHAIREHNRREGRHYLDNGSGWGDSNSRPLAPEASALRT